MDTLRMLKFARNGYIVTSLLFAAAGFGMIYNPDRAAELICIFAGLLFILDGFVKMVGYFSKDFYCLAFQFDFAFGILMAAVGIILIARRNVVDIVLFGIFGIMILSDALCKVQICMDAKRFGLEGLWWKLMLVAIATGFLGALVLIHPVRGMHYMIRLAGGSFLAEGVLNLLIAVFMVRILKIKPDLYQGDSIELAQRKEEEEKNYETF